MAFLLVLKWSEKVDIAICSMSYIVIPIFFTWILGILHLYVFFTLLSFYTLRDMLLYFDRIFAMQLGDHLEKFFLLEHWRYYHGGIQQQKVLHRYYRNKASKCSKHYRHRLWGGLCTSIGLQTWKGHCSFKHGTGERCIVLSPNVPHSVYDLDSSPWSSIIGMSSIVKIWLTSYSSLQLSSAPFLEVQDAWMENQLLLFILQYQWIRKPMLHMTIQCLLQHLVHQTILARHRES